MRLGILIYSLSGGGAERVVSYLVTYCMKNDIDVHLILMNPNIQYNIPKTTKVYFIEKSKPNESGVLKALKIPYLAFKYARLAKKLKLTHSLSFLTRPSFINILSNWFTSYKYKIITNERAFPSLQYGYKGFQSSFNKILIKALYNKSEVVISNSYGNANDLIKNFKVSRQKMKVIHNPIDLDKIKAINAIEGFFDDSKFNMITIGRLDIGKNHILLIEALYKLQKPSLRLYIIGAGNMKGDLEDLISKRKLQKQVILLGFDPNPYKYLKAADLFVFGSDHEGFPNVLLEAMACKLPILSTNCQSGPSEIMELKKTKLKDIMITEYGILAPVKNVDVMAKGMSYFLQNAEFIKYCAINGEKRSKDFEKNKILNEYLDLIRQI
jgi:glycosyltransferase involved in cell wall biosynthesis